MKTRLLSALIIAALLLGGATSASAAGFSLFGSYLDLDEPDAAIGLGVRLDVALSSNWTLDFTLAYHEAADVTLNADLVNVQVIEEITFIPFDIGFRYHFGDSDGFAPYLGFGLSALEFDTTIGEGDPLLGGYAVFGVDVGDDIGPKFFAEASYRGYDDVELDLFSGLSSTDSDAFAVDGFSAALGIRWQF